MSLHIMGRLIYLFESLCTLVPSFLEQFPIQILFILSHEGYELPFFVGIRSVELLILQLVI